MNRQLEALAMALELDPEVLSRHLVTPLAPPISNALGGWRCHPSHGRVLSVCDGFALFGSDPWDRFVFLGSDDLPALGAGDYVGDRSRELNIVPVFGSVPHLTSVRATDGVVVASDWEDEGGEGWLRPIASSLSEYISTVIVVREAYGYDADGMPSDWWHPYASSGTRFDLNVS